jgi:rod shape-determining protein MreC
VKSQINAKIKKSNHFGSLVWNGKICAADWCSKISICRKGDTIVTGGQSVIFQRISMVLLTKFISITKQIITLDIKLFNDMTNLGHVYIIKSKIAKNNNLEKRNTDE